MSFQLQMCVKQRISQKLYYKLSLEGEGMTESVLVGTEKYLFSSSVVQNTLDLFTIEDPRVYRGVTDWLLCSVFQEWQKPCWKYYCDGNWLLREILTKNEIKLVDKAIFLALRCGVEVKKRKMNITPLDFKISIREILRITFSGIESMILNYTTQLRFNEPYVLREIIELRKNEALSDMWSWRDQFEILG